MAKTVLYSCPKHKDQLLFEEEDLAEEQAPAASLGESFLQPIMTLWHSMRWLTWQMMLIPKRPGVCPKCGKAYFKWQCIKNIKRH